MDWLFPDAFRQTGNRKNLLRVRDFLSEQPMPYQYRGWTLYAYDVPGEDETTIYFFSESKPKQGVALEGPPAGMEAALGNDGLPTLIEHRDVTALRKVDPFEFEDRIRRELDARPAKRGRGDKGIDGWLRDGRPLQIKQADDVQRPVIDAFETAVRRDGKDAGVVVAFSFTSGAIDEAKRAGVHDGLNIKLKTVGEVLSETVD